MAQAPLSAAIQALRQLMSSPGGHSKPIDSKSTEGQQTVLASVVQDSSSSMSNTVKTDTGLPGRAFTDTAAVVIAQASNGAANASNGNARTFRVDPATNKVVLPDGTPLDSVELSGNNIIIRLPDGSLIIIQDAVTQTRGPGGGSIVLPTLVVDNAEIPSSTLATALGLDATRVAAGPQNADGSGGDLAAPGDGIGSGLFALGVNGA